MVTSIEEMTMYTPEKKFVVMLLDLNKLYCQHLKELGMEVQGRIRSTRLKNRILSHFPGFRIPRILSHFLVLMNEKFSWPLMPILVSPWKFTKYQLR